MTREAVERVISAARERDVADYREGLWKEACEAEARGNTQPARALRHIGDACSLHLRSDNVAEPFGPMAVIEGKSTAHRGSVDDALVATLRDFANAATDCELRARCADVVWVVKRDHKLALVAIEAYIESAKRLHDPEHWVAPMARIERAYGLAAMLNHEEAFERISTYAKRGSSRPRRR